MGDFVTSESERQELFSKWVAPLDEKWREAQSKTPDEANRARVQRGIAGAWIDMLAREGAPSAINSYDSAILTWGAGFAWAGGAGGLTNLFTFAQQTQRVRTFFHNCGFHYTSAVDPKTKKASPQALKVVDVRDGKILTGNEAAEYCCDAKQSDSPSAQGQPQLLHMLIQAARDPDMRDEVREANLSAFRKLHDRIPGLHLIKSQAVFSFIVHMHHYGPALANNCIPYAQHYATALSSLTVPSLEADAHFALWTIRHAWAGNSADFKQVQGFWRDMVADAKSRENAPLPIEGLRSAADIMKQIGMAAGSPAANAIPADHKRGYVDQKNPNSPVYDLGPLTDFPPRLKKY
jgi:hypothetical protein